MCFNAVLILDLVCLMRAALLTPNLTTEAMVAARRMCPGWQLSIGNFEVNLEKFYRDFGDSKEILKHLLSDLHD